MNFLLNKVNKETYIWIKRQYEGIFAVYASDKVLIPRTHKGFKRLITENKKNPINKWTNKISIIFNDEVKKNDQ